jgi:hypothetical protein
MVTAARYLQASAHQPERVLIAVTPDRRAPHDDSFAKNAAVSRKKTRSVFTLASSRRRVASSSSGDLRHSERLAGLRQFSTSAAQDVGVDTKLLRDMADRRLRTTRQRQNPPLTIFPNQVKRLLTNFCITFS